MRELRFRCWDRVAELYLSNGNWTGINQDGNPWLAIEGKDVLGDSDRWIVEQYTGLKDKNDKEIWEGDIVRCYSRQKLLGEYQVIWNEDCGGFECESLKPLVDGGDSMLRDVRVFNEMFIQFRVIGNIHENPELLGDENE